MASCGWTDVAKDTVPAKVKFAREIEELTSDVIGYGMIFHFMTYSRDEMWIAVFHVLSRPVDCETQVDGVPFEENFGDMKRSMRLIPKQGVDRPRPSQRSNSENHFAIHEGWSGWHRRVCPVFAH